MALRLSRTVKQHWGGILAFMETKLTNGVMEAVNGVLKTERRMARGFRSFRYFRIIAYLESGGLKLSTAPEGSPL